MKDKQVIKGSLNLIILKLLSEKEAMYGYEICQKVRDLTNEQVQVSEAALYPALHKLEAEGILECHYQEIEGRTRKYYSLTQKGNNVAESKIKEFLEMLKNIEKVLLFPNLKTI